MQSTIEVDSLDLAKTQVVLVTSYGTMTLGFLPDKAPNHVRNFLELSRSGFYAGTAFHRILPNFAGANRALQPWVACDLWDPDRRERLRFAVVVHPSVRERASQN